MSKRTLGTTWIFFTITITAATKYKPTIMGTIFEATLAILLIPPKITTETKLATKNPVKRSPNNILLWNKPATL